MTNLADDVVEAIAEHAVGLADALEAAGFGGPLVNALNGLAHEAAQQLEQRGIVGVLRFDDDEFDGGSEWVQ